MSNLKEGTTWTTDDETMLLTFALEVWADVATLVERSVAEVRRLRSESERLRDAMSDARSQIDQLTKALSVATGTGAFGSPYLWHCRDEDCHVLNFAEEANCVGCGAPHEVSEQTLNSPGCDSPLAGRFASKGDVKGVSREKKSPVVRPDDQQNVGVDELPACQTSSRVADQQRVASIAETDNGRGVTSAGGESGLPHHSTASDQDNDTAHAVALQVLCRVFEDGADVAMEEWLEWYKPEQWLWYARGLGSFIARRLAEKRQLTSDERGAFERLQAAMQLVSGKSTPVEITMRDANCLVHAIATPPSSPPSIV